MKTSFKLLTVIFFITIASCHAQKIVQKIGDAKKLQVQEKEFIGKPLKDLIAQIGPTIKYVQGNPENRWSQSIGGTYFKFVFVNRLEYQRKRAIDEKPTGITVEFLLEPNNTRIPLPKEGLTSWGSVETQQYGDMVISHIYVSGEN